MRPLYGMAATVNHQNSSCSASDACLQERRRNRRLSVRLAVAVRLPGPGGEPTVVERTVTRNISPGDMCFESGLAGRLRQGDPVEVDIELPVDGATIFAERRLQARGRVVRLEASGLGAGPAGVAIVFEGPPAFHSPNA